MIRSKTNATKVEERVATSVGPTIAVGSTDPTEARMAITVPGINVTLDVHNTTNVHMASEAVLSSPLKLLRSSIALSPKGVAAWPMPSMLAMIDMTIEALAG